MCVALALPLAEFSPDQVERHELRERIYSRADEREVRFYWRALPTLLPVLWGGSLDVVTWGNRSRHERKLPPTGWTWRETVEEGKWSALEPEPVLVPASFGLMNGVWYKVKQGMQGLVVRDRAGLPVVYLLCEPATRYYQVMTRAEWMPCLVGEVI